MKWSWRVRIYSPNGDYCIGQIETERNLHEIDIRKDFYQQLTGCKMLLEGMAEQAFPDTMPIEKAFLSMWSAK